MRRPDRFTRLALAGVLALVGAACSGGSSNEASSGGPADKPAEAAATPPTPEPGTPIPNGWRPRTAAGT